MSVPVTQGPSRIITNKRIVNTNKRIAPKCVRKGPKCVWKDKTWKIECDGNEKEKWGVGPEGKEKAKGNCDYATTQGHKKDICPCGSSSFVQTEHDEDNVGTNS